jgi:hypothetical protein
MINEPTTAVLEALQKQMKDYQTEQQEQLKRLQEQITSRWSASAQAATAQTSTNEPVAFGVMLVAGGAVGTVEPKLNITVPIEQLPVVGAMALNLLIQMAPRAGEEYTLLVWTPPLPIGQPQGQPQTQARSKK